MVLDTDGSDAAAAAKLVSSTYPSQQAVFYVGGGAAAWQAAGLPWRTPLKLDLGALKQFDFTGVASGGAG